MLQIIMATKVEVTSQIPSSKSPMARRCFGVDTDNEMTSPTASWNPINTSHFINWP
jgi:hypothetical protein